MTNIVDLIKPGTLVWHLTDPRPLAAVAVKGEHITCRWIDDVGAVVEHTFLRCELRREDEMPAPSDAEPMTG